MQNGNQQDWIKELIEATRAEERAKLESQAVLNEINQRLITIESFQRELNKEINWLRGIVQATYNNVSTLIQLMAAMWQGDRATLVEIQTRMSELAFETSPDRDISISAGGNVTVSADEVGGSKDERDED